MYKNEQSNKFNLEANIKQSQNYNSVGFDDRCTQSFNPRIPKYNNQRNKPHQRIKNQSRNFFPWKQPNRGKPQFTKNRSQFIKNGSVPDENHSHFSYSKQKTIKSKWKSFNYQEEIL